MARKGRFDVVVDKIYGEMNNRIDRIAVNLRHEKAPGQKPLPKYEQLAQYMQIREDPQAWTQIVQQHGIPSAIKYRKSMEALLKRTVEKHTKEFDGLNDIPGFENAPIPAALIPGMEQPAAPAPAPAPAGGMEGEPQQI